MWMRGRPPARTGTTPCDAATKRSRIAVSRGPYTALGRRIVKGTPELLSASSPASLDRPYAETGPGARALVTCSPVEARPAGGLRRHEDDVGARRVGSRRLRDVRRAAGVRGHVLGLVPRGGFPGDVHDRRRAFDERRKRRGVADVALHEVDGGALQPRDVVRPAHERAHAVARGEERVRDVAPDEPVPPVSATRSPLCIGATLSQG